MKILRRAETAWQGMLDHFNEHPVGTYFLRREWKDKGIEFWRKRKTAEGSHKYLDELSMNVIDQYTLVLRRAGYLKDIEPGVYKKVRRTPKDLSSTKAVAEAWPKKDSV